MVDGGRRHQAAQDEAIVRDGDEAYCFGYTANTRRGSEVLLKTRTWCLETPAACEEMRLSTHERVKDLQGAISVSDKCRTPFLMSCHTSISREFGPSQSCSLLETECNELRERKLHSSLYRNVSGCGLVRPKSVPAAIHQTR